MSKLLNEFKKNKKSYLLIMGVLSLILLAALLLWFNNSKSLQADGATPAKVYFDGQYRIENGEWQPLKAGEHVPSTKGDVTLKINFHLMDPYGNPLEDKEGVLPLAFYTDHIGLTFYSGGKPVRVIDNENPEIGESACAENWTMHPIIMGVNKPTEIVVSNPHRFGNETAIDEMLSRLAIWGEENHVDFEKEILNSGEPQRNAGMLFILVSIVFLGIALFSTLIHIKSNRTIWLLGLAVLSAGAYITYSADGVSFWSESVVSNTILLGASMMFYMLFLSILITCLLKTTKLIGNVTVVLLGVANAVFFVLPILSDIFFYDTWAWWVVVQLVANAVITVCLVREFFVSKARFRWFCLGAIAPLNTFVVDVLGTKFAVWKGGVVSQYVFIILFAVATITVLKYIPKNINAATKAKELEMEKIVLNAELAESRISTMMSQIRPHFIYNTLGSIEQLCDLDPKKAGELVHDFAKYLRGNFGELDNPKPILMSQEMDHVHHYVSIENVRFPDMTFTFEMNSEDFHIPALTVQPIVENAIKHGLMKLQKGGSIRVVSYETETDYCVSVVDDGAGFDTRALFEDRKHVGLRNIRERLKAMVNGSIEIESTVGVGTKVIIKIPKEVIG